MATRLDLDTAPATDRFSALPALSGGYERPQIRSRSARLFSRMRDILAANLGEMLDHSPEPEQMIRMIICEMEETLVHVRATTARTIADQKELKAAQSRLREIAEGWREKAEFALAADREDLARQALAEKAKAEDRATELDDEISALDTTLASNHTDIARLQHKLSEACARRSNIRARLETAENSIKMRELLNGGALKDAFARFDTLERTVDAAEGHAEAAMIGYDDSEEIARNRKLNAKVDAELAAMKNAKTK